MLAQAAELDHLQQTIPLSALGLQRAEALALHGGGALISGSAQQPSTLRSEKAVVRLRSGGSPDISWGNNGQIAWSDFSRDRHTQVMSWAKLLPAGHVWVERRYARSYLGSSTSWHTIDRYDARGQWVGGLEGFSADDILHIYADGRFLSRNGAAGFARYQRDGSPDPTFSAWTGGQVLAAGVDVSERVYVQLSERPAGAPGNVLRLRPDGTLDTSYVPDFLPLSASEPVVVLADGSVLHRTANCSLARISPDGQVNCLYPQENVSADEGILLDASAGPNGSMALLRGFRGQDGAPGLLKMATWYDPGKGERPWLSPPLSPRRNMTASSQGAWWVSGGSLLQATPPSQEPLVGFPQKIFILHAANPRVRLERSGDVTGTAAVEGTLVPMQGAGPLNDESVGVTWQFDPGTREAWLDLVMQPAPASAGIESFLLVLNSARGAHLSEFRTASALVLRDLPAGEGELSIGRVQLEFTPDILLILRGNP
ncbi:MAG TPA: hypothetical protein VD994_00315, partial [Prosthecobacter sp.]|nr:hypothetical protein [Prosthecobacter sp.]